MKINEQELLDILDKSSISSGYEYFNKKMILECKVLEETPQLVLLRSEVLDNSGKSYKQHIKLLRNADIRLSGGCNCSVGYNCKHIFAVCLEYINESQEKDTIANPDNEVKNWIDKITKFSSQEKNISDFKENDDFLTYRIFNDKNSHYKEDIKFYRSKLLKKGTLSKGTSIKSDNLLYTYAHEDIKSSEDKEILNLAKGIIHKHFTREPEELKGELGSILLKKMVKTNRCFYQDSPVPLRFSNELRDIEFFWKDMDDESVKLVSNIDKNLRFLNTKPLMAIDEDFNLVYEFKENISGDLLGLLNQSPQIKNDEINEVYDLLSKNIKDFRLPLPKNYNGVMKFYKSSDIIIQSRYDEGSDWFALSFDVKFDGKDRSLVKLISPLIEQFQSFESLPDVLDIEVEDNHFLKIEKNEIEPILKTIFALFDKKDKDGNLNVAFYEAHLLEEMVFKDSDELLELSNKLKNFKGLEFINPPQSLNATLRGYQQDGLNWLGFLHEFKFCGILADDMGLGKTIQTISHLSKLKEDKKLDKPVLIIMPTSLIANWKNEIKRFATNLSVLSLHGADRSKRMDQIKEHDIVLSTYALVVRDFNILEKEQFSYIILDEAQKIKNPKTKMSMAIKSLKSDHRLALSGTPIENHLGELWSIFDFLIPGFLGSLNSFKKQFQTPIEKENDKEKQEQLNKRIKPFMIRRTKDEVVDELPEKSEIIKYTQFDTKQAKLYETIRVTMEKKVKDAIEKKGLGNSHITILDALLKLRQVCCDPSLLKMQEALNVNDSAKLELFLDLVEELLSEGKKILVFSQFTSMLSIIQEAIEKKDISYTKLTGSTIDREKVIDKFKSGDADIFLISLKAGGVGLNLVEADTVIHFDPWWNPAVENQATDRAYRIGQTKAVFVYKLIVENTIEEKIIELQKKKQILQENIYDDKKDDEDIFKGSELLELLKK